jgi:beta-glucosidase
MADAVTQHGMVPMVTLNHFTLPRWVAAMGGWLSPEVPELFARYCERVVSRLGPVDWYATLNEPGAVAFGGYLGALGFPPGRRSVAAWERSSDHLVTAHLLARAAVKQARPEARVGAFGLVGVDRVTQDRQVQPSARLLGEIARTGTLEA